MFTVYVLHNREKNKIYIGQTEDLNQRLKEHNNNVFKDSYTGRYKGEWKLIYREDFLTRSEVLKREKQLKSYRGREFVKNYIPR